ncbi:MAG: MFS transporter, partial [Alphaproteobacteria bacterium]|nr:MFS transporter [Alphaproteobacteria bacterium]
MPSPPIPGRDQGKPPALALAIATLAPVGMTVQFHRTSIATVAPDIRSELALSPEAMSLVAGTLFLTFGLCQIATGVLLDRYGPRRVMTGGLVLMALGSALFSFGRDAGELMLARFVLGLGSSGLYLGCLIIL